MKAIRFALDECVVVVEYPAHAWLSPFAPRELAVAVRAMAHTAANLTCSTSLSVDLHLVDDAAIQFANRKYMACAGPTNVLSFPGGDGMRGILLFSLDTFGRECLLYGQEPATHILRLLAHGMGHLAGLGHGAVMDTVCAACFEAARVAVD